MAFFKELIVKITGDSSGLQTATKKATKEVSDFDKGLKNIGSGIAAAFSVGVVIKFGEQSVKAFDEAAKSQAKLLSALNGQVEVQKRLSAQATSLQSKSLFDDESIQGAQMFLATMKLNEGQITRLLPLIMDFATKTGSDLVSAANVVAKTIGSSTNALGRYGIEVEGASGSTQRFNMVVEGLTKQVGGLAKASAEAGTSGLVQLKDAINDIQEGLGASIWENSGFGNFIKNVKSLIELKTGKTLKNIASDAETAGRQLVSQTKNIEQGKFVLENYLENLKQRAELEAKLGADQSKGILKTGLLPSVDKMAAEAHLQNAKGLAEAYKNLLNVYRDYPEMMKLIEDGNKQTALSAEELAKIAEKEAKASAEKLKSLQEEYRLRMQITGIEGNTVGMDQALKLAEMQKKFPEMMNGLAGKKAFDMIGMKGGATLPTSIPMKPMDTPGLAVSTITPEFISQLEQQAKLWDKNYEAMVKYDSMAEMIKNSLLDIGDALSQGGDSWTDFGTKAANAIRTVILGLIAQGITAAITNTLAGPAGKLGPIGVGIAGLAGGLAAGLLGTLVPSFAGGGVVNGPTLAMVGDNPGKKEAIIPSEMWGNMGGGGRLYADISPRKLRVILDQDSRTSQRMGK